MVKGILMLRLIIVQYYWIVIIYRFICFFSTKCNICFIIEVVLPGYTDRIGIPDSFTSCFKLFVNPFNKLFETQYKAGLGIGRLTALEFTNNFGLLFSFKLTIAILQAEKSFKVYENSRFTFYTYH